MYFCLHFNSYLVLRPSKCVISFKIMFNYKAIIIYWEKVFKKGDYTQCFKDMGKWTVSFIHLWWEHKFLQGF